ncbi:MAG: hypothetical protein D6776_01125 [Planctomycetota bacterium]|nr:MAG: hypothetical protein D6776_01125 [Planctomycetota bacterium]
MHPTSNTTGSAWRRNATPLVALLAVTAFVATGCPGPRAPESPQRLPPPATEPAPANAAAPATGMLPPSEPPRASPPTTEPRLVPLERGFAETRLPHDDLACEPTEVARVIDGDTVQLADGRRLRLIGINTPERGEPLYRAATAFTKAFCATGPLELCHDVERTDQYGRALGYLYRDGHNLSAELVRRGLAYCYTFVPNVRFRDELLALQRKARAERLGLWSLPAPAPEPYYVSSRRQVHFHRPSCPSARRISASSRVVFRSREAAFDSGRNPCRRCRP